MSAACAPATTTSPAADPRGRLFTIFISTSICYPGRDRSPSGAAHPGRSPYAPLNLPVRPLPSFPGHRTNRKEATSGAPLRRTLTLTHLFQVATTKKHFEQRKMQFSDRCCLKNTCEPAARQAQIVYEQYELAKNPIHRNVLKSLPNWERRPPH